MLKNPLIEYFGFNRQQRNGLLMLMAIIVLLFIVRLSLVYFVPPSGIRMEKLERLQLAGDSMGWEKARDPGPAPAEKGALFYFDPNTISVAELLKLGLSEKKAATFIRFREKGFVFTKKEDLKKIYGLSAGQYERLSPYVKIAEKKLKEYPPSFNQTVAQIAPLELNSADSAQLVALPGIGPAYAKRIIKYRSLLGGFADISQLKEVYGFPPETFVKIRDKIWVDATGVRKLDLNKDDFKILTRHPYIGYDRTKAIFEKRKKGPVSIEGLKDLYTDTFSYRKLMPYIQQDQ